MQRAEFWSEAERWSKLSHAHVVCLVGLCRGGTDAGCPALLYEFSFYGDLHEYLLVHSPHSDIAVVDNAGRSASRPAHVTSGTPPTVRKAIPKGSLTGVPGISAGFTKAPEN